MKKICCLTIGLCSVGISLLQAQQMELNPEDIRSAASRKMFEVKKNVVITSLQEVKIQEMGEIYFWKVDSAKYIIKDSYIAEQMCTEAVKNFFLGLKDILTTEQMTTYLMKKEESYIRKRTNERIEKLKEKLKNNDIESYYDQVYQYVSKEKVAEIMYQYDIPQRDLVLAQIREKQPEILTRKGISPNAIADAAERKVTEINGIVSLMEKQKEKVLAASKEYYFQMDSAKYLAKNVKKVGDVRYNANKKFFDSLMKIFDENQQYAYLESLSCRDAKLKAESKWLYLKESGQYNEAELKQFYDEIYEFTLMEKMANLRYKYNPDKQKENADLLKKQRPKSLSEANALEKAKLDGKNYTGSYQW